MEWVIIAIHHLVLGISLAAPVGPINIEMIKRGISGGFWSSWLVGLGGMSADVLFMVFILIGLAPFIQQEAVTFVLYGAGCLMLIYIGIQSIRQAASHAFVFEESHPTSAQRSYASGFLIALTNPINIVFWFGVYGSTLSHMVHAYTLLQASIASICIIVGIILWNMNIAFTVHFTRRFIHTQLLRVITVIAGIILIGYGAHFGIKFFSMLE
ncbi:LysE family transporter [Metabacillus iocasae]|uniref:Threonine/homoserine/homoserine lactone efflux protein n=1 Tax=Priestia iocasae TaxID=2291674 RepID=A0ABS2QWA9_9BACI|nr:LysE family transporter [Metabacillus iocasae]MBM7703768.1 threonine/homoserine/homoserine lactone efflux protein [Metabacillus iocasae]